MLKPVNKRYCFAKFCPNYYGTSDPNVKFFRSPYNDPVLKAKWEELLNRKISGRFLLCPLHFNEEDILRQQKVIRLKKGALPKPWFGGSESTLNKDDIPITIPKTEISQESLAQSVRIVDIDAIKRATNEQNPHLNPHLNPDQSGTNYDGQLQAKIKQLQKKLGELATENLKLKNQVRIELPLGNKCSLCEAELTTLEFEQHLCIDQQSIFCPICQYGFKSIIGFLKHIVQHSETLQLHDDKTLYQCNQCNVKYPMEVLLKCHKKSHNDTIQQSKIIEIKTEPEEPMSIDETASNDYTTLPESSVKVEPKSVESNEIHESVVPMFRSSNAIKSYGRPIKSSTQSNPVEVSPKPNLLKIFQCGLCDMSYEYAIQLHGHMHVHHQIKNPKIVNLQCFLCKITFDSITKLQKHMKRHKRNHKCEICQAALTRNELNSHLCDEGKSIRCDYCPIEFTAIVKLVEHLEKSHSTKTMYKCEKCPKFFSMTLKKYHMKTHEQEPSKQFICDVCSKAFAKKKYLQYHSETHNENKLKFLCEECGKAFPNARGFERHQKSFIHKNDTPIQCPDCPKKFVNTTELNKHSDSHREDKYVCEICQAVLLSKNSYRGHMKRHNRTEADRKFACKICPLKFFHSTDLKYHQAVHTGLKLFNCQFCSQSYKYSGDLQKHMKIHLGDKIYECPKCSKRFQYHAELKKHELVHYKEEKEANGTNE